MARNRMSISVSRSLGELNISSMYLGERSSRFAHREIHPSMANAEFAPPRRCQASGVGVGISRVATRHRRTSDERVRAITATSTRFHRTVIDRGGHCGSRATKSTPLRSDVASRAARHTFDASLPRIRERPRR